MCAYCVALLAVDKEHDLADDAPLRGLFVCYVIFLLFVTVRFSFCGGGKGNVGVGCA